MEIEISILNLFVVQGERVRSKMEFSFDEYVSELATGIERTIIY